MSIDLATLDREDGFKLGLCYFDPTSESLYEISQESGYMLSADSYRSVVHKVYVVTGTETPITSLVVKPIRSPEVEDIFDIKVATGPIQPSMMTFEELPSYNTLRQVVDFSSQHRHIHYHTSRQGDEHQKQNDSFPDYPHAA